MEHLLRNPQFNALIEKFMSTEDVLDILLGDNQNCVKTVPSEIIKNGNFGTDRTFVKKRSWMLVVAANKITLTALVNVNGLD